MPNKGKLLDHHNETRLVIDGESHYLKQILHDKGRYRAICRCKMEAIEPTFTGVVSMMAYHMGLAWKLHGKYHHAWSGDWDDTATKFAIICECGWCTISSKTEHAHDRFREHADAAYRAQSKAVRDAK
jgi:hypothetical protein